MSASTNRRRIRPVAHPVDAAVPVPGSKSVTNRMLLMAAVADGVSTINGVLRSDDTDDFAQALTSLGFRLDYSPDHRSYRVQGSGGIVPAKSARVWCGSAGTAARFLPAVAAAGCGQYHFDASEQMRRRPMDSLLGALESQGAVLARPTGGGAFPLSISASGLRGGPLELGGTAVSSQYLSALLMAAPLAQAPTEITTTVPISRPYIDLTCKLMRRFGVKVDRQGYERFTVPAGPYTAGDHTVEPDASTASYFFAAAAVTGGSVTIPNLSRGSSVQGDIRFLDVLERMGCSVASGGESVTVTGPSRLRGVTVDMSGISDTVMTLACIAPFAASDTAILNVGHIRAKESDRIAALSDGLSRMGVSFEETADSLVIHPSRPVGAVIDSFGDHRIAMAFSVMGLACDGVVIEDPHCVFKTCPEFFDLLELLY